MVEGIDGIEDAHGGAVRIFHLQAQSEFLDPFSVLCQFLYCDARGEPSVAGEAHGAESPAYPNGMDAARKEVVPDLSFDGHALYNEVAGWE